MSCLFNGFLKLFQYFGTFFGFFYLHIDFHKRVLKIRKFIKLYVYFVNILFMAFYTGYVIVTFDPIVFKKQNDVLSFFVLLFRFIGIIIFFLLILLRIKEEKVLRKWLNTLNLLQTTYLEKISYKSNDKTAQIIIILKIFITVVIYNLFYFYLYIEYAISNDWWNIADAVSNHYLRAMQQYILLHHSLNLYYINNDLLKLNNQLQYQKVKQPFASIYKKLCLLLQQVNTLNGSIIFFVLTYQLMNISLYTFLNIFLYIDDALFLKEYIQLCILVLSSIDLILYFLICERIHWNSYYTGCILKEYSTRDSNPEVSIPTFC